MEVAGAVEMAHYPDNEITMNHHQPDDPLRAIRTQARNRRHEQYNMNSGSTDAGDL